MRNASAFAPVDNPRATAAAAGVRLARRRIYILPTRQGLFFGVLLVVLLLGSANYNSGLGYALTFLIASLALVSMLHAYRDLVGLGVLCADAAPVYAGASARFPVVIDNRGGRERYALEISLSGRGGDTDPDRVHLAADLLARHTLAVDASRRGRLTVPGVTLATRYPLGLFRAWSTVGWESHGIVYPRPTGSRPLPPGSVRDGCEVGAGGGGCEDFAGLREYRLGDSPHQIHWKAVARERGVPVKLFSGAAPADLTLHWAATTGLATEARLSQLCRWALEANATGLRFGLLLPGVRIAPASGARHLRACLTALALYGTS